SRRAQGPGRRRGRRAAYSTRVRSPPASVLAARSARARGGCRTFRVPVDAIRASVVPRAAALIAAVVASPCTDVVGLGAGLLGLDTAFEREPGLDEEAGGGPEGAARHLAGTECGLSPGHVGRPRRSSTP